MKLERYQGVSEGMEKRQRPSDLPVSGRPCFWPGCPGISSWGPPPFVTQTPSPAASSSDALSSTSTPTTTVDGAQAMITVTDFSSSSTPSDSVPTDLTFQSAAQSSSSSPTPATIIGAVLGSIFGLLLLLAFCVCLRRRRLRNQPPPENEKIEAFNVDAKWKQNPDFVINITAPPNEHGIQPYPYLHPTSATTTTTLSSSKISEKKTKYGLRASSSTAASAISSSSASSYPSTMSYEEQQRMMEQLNALQMHLRHVEAQVRNVNENQVGAGEQEPPPMYVVALDGEGRPETPRRREKM